MKNATHKTALVIIPPDEIWGPIQAIRQEHDRHVRRWMPHITLFYPFVPVSEFDAAHRELVPVCRRCQPFDVTLRRFDVFDHGKGHHTVWLAPEPEEPLLDLHATLWAALCEPDELERGLRRFIPHLSVGQVRGKARVAELIEDLQAEWAPVRFRVDSVRFISRREPPDDVFRIERSLKLHGR